MLTLFAQVNHASVTVVWCLPFAVMLAAIAVTPFINKHWWEKNYTFVSLGLGAMGMIYYLLVRRDMGPWLHEVEEYVSFITLLGSLFVVSGGIVIHVLRKATPLVNTVFLLFGAVAANLFGTTGASMLLIRPYLRINRNHIKPFHVVFFIFVVSNVGGCLTPIGDPPLFLGYLRGVPFWWVMQHCWPMWATAVGVIVAIFFVIDTRDHGKAPRNQSGDAGPAVQIVGIHNLLFMLVIIGAVFRESVFEAAWQLHKNVTGWHLLGLVTSREVLMLAAAVVSRWVTPKLIYERNEFSFGPMREVAILFIGIFSTMVPVLEYLEVNANQLPVKTPGQYYFVSGGLSSVLDNAPTYAAFLQMRLGAVSFEGVGAASEQARIAFHLADPALNLFIMAISCGAVFFGACTYIGNGPNFMVKSIADAAGVKMPGFFGYVIRYALPVLIPTYLLIWLIYFFPH